MKRGKPKTSLLLGGGTPGLSRGKKKATGRRRKQHFDESTPIARKHQRKVPFNTRNFQRRGKRQNMLKKNGSGHKPASEGREGGVAQKVDSLKFRHDAKSEERCPEMNTAK